MSLRQLSIAVHLVVLVIMTLVPVAVRPLRAAACLAGGPLVIASCCGG